MIIRIYQDHVFNNGVLAAALRAARPEDDIDFCDADDILSGTLSAVAAPDLFVMPGGEDLYYCEKLNGAGNAAIRNYVASGGRYLGICAGAYYACREIFWAEGTPYEISGARELVLTQAVARGPVLSYIEDGDPSQSPHQAALLQDTESGETFRTFYAAGPVFESPNDCDVIARYADLPGRPPAILSGSYGKGFFLLSSPHIEYTADGYARSRHRHNNPDYLREMDVLSRLRPDNNKQKEFWDRLLNRLLQFSHEP